MNFTYLESRSGGESRELLVFATTVGIAMQNLYDDNSDEEYRQALRDTSYTMCKLLELRNIPLNRTPLTAEWLDSMERREYRREGAIK
jgi:hypothetical protein